MNANCVSFWKDISGFFPDIVTAITSLSTKSYFSVTNLRNDLTWWSQGAMDFLGLKENYTLRGREKSDKTIHPDDIAVFKKGFADRIAGKNLDQSWEYRVKNGNTYNRICASARLLKDEAGNPFILIIRYNNYGISDEVDSVTGLRTESALNRKITKLLSADSSSALLKITLDQFSNINVLYGNDFADELLSRVADELLHEAGASGSVYRLFGAKFVIVFEQITKDELFRAQSRICESLLNTIAINGNIIPLKTSAGAVFVKPDMKDANAVRSRLTFAVNHSRSAHHGELVVFNDEFNGNNAKQFNLIGVIHQCAITDFRGFRLFYQPIADTRTGRICGMEALIRWELEPYGLVTPGVFMEWLEQDPCMFDLGNWILRTALNDIKIIQNKIPDFFVNVNITAAQLERKEFRTAVIDILKETNSQPDELCLELTERCKNLDLAFLEKEVSFFHSQGIKIALDDFGTGSSSLSLALALPFDELKVDMSFIKDIKDKPQNQAMIQSIVDYAKRTDTETCIEGIENEDVNHYISRFGATWHQGYYYSKPVPIDQLEEIVEENYIQ